MRRSHNPKIIRVLTLVMLAGLLGCSSPYTQTITPSLASPSVTFNLDDGVWMGPPASSVDGNSPLLFRLDFESEKWELAPYFQGQKLVHRIIYGCEIAPTMGGEPPEGYSIEHSNQSISGVVYGTNFVHDGNGNLEYITYFILIGRLQTGFLVENEDQCIQDAEVVLATLQTEENPGYSP